ncbi:MAG: enoyl-CoA hydratase [bacterium]|nr:enoyl-CoA hydratase [bacterium]
MDPLVTIDSPREGVVVLTLDDPERRNALGPVMVEALSTALAAHDRARAIVLRGAGRVFCAGGDLRSMQDSFTGTREQRVEPSQRFGSLLDQLDQHRAITIAQVERPAYGGGVGLAAACDIVVCHSSIRFTLSEVTLGLTPSNIAPYIVRRLGPAASRRVLATAPKLSASEAQRLGLVDLVADDVAAVVMDECNRVLTCGPDAVAATKELIRSVATSSWQDAQAAAAIHLADTWERAEAQAGIEAFVSKSIPPWKPVP